MKMIIACIFAVMALVLSAAENVYNPVAPLFSGQSESTPNGAWLSGINGASCARKQSADGMWIIELKNGQQFKFAFNKHTPLALDKLPQDAAMSLKVKCAAVGSEKIKMSFCWLFDGGKKSEVTTVLFVPKKDWQEIILPLPKNAEAQAKSFILTIGSKGDYELTDIAVVTCAKISLSLLPEKALLHRSELMLGGQAADGIKTVEAVLSGRTLAATAVKDGKFTLTVPKSVLPECTDCSLKLDAIDAAGKRFSLSTPVFFVYPELRGRRLPPVTVNDGKLCAAGRPFAFGGTNYTDFDLGLSINPDMDYQRIALAVKTMAEWKLSVVRISINLSLLQPAEGVFPDNPQYREIMVQHGLKPHFFEYYEYFVQLAADHGIYSIVDFHGFPVNPYRYFVGGMPSDKDKGLPGKAICWLEPDKKSSRIFPDFSKEREINAICTTFNWLAGHFKANPNILAFEVPYNEPNDAFMSIPSNYYRVVEKVIDGITKIDPSRLTFTMPAAWGHDNVTWPATIMPPKGASGVTPHFYIANGPVPLRPDAAKSQQPWLCRDVEASFSYGMAAVLLPYSSLRHPIYNGEGGEHGNGSFLPELPRELSADYMIDGTLTQCYAAGIAGTLQWTLWQSHESYDLYKDLYAKHYRRFSEVYTAGPVDWNNAEVAFVQNPGALPISNGHNYSCVPFAQLMLDLHLAPVHYLTDDQVIYSGLTNVSEGLEQVSASAFSANYKALIVDTRNLDDRVMRSLKNGKLPILWTDDPARLRKDDVVKFLTKCGVEVNTKSPAEVQLIKGPKHLVLYRRYGDNKKVKIFPRLKIVGKFNLVDENGKTVFDGDAKNLYESGLNVELPRWKSLILAIK